MFLGFGVEEIWRFAGADVVYTATVIVIAGIALWRVRLFTYNF